MSRSGELWPPACKRCLRLFSTAVYYDPLVYESVHPRKSKGKNDTAICISNLKCFKYTHMSAVRYDEGPRSLNRVPGVGIKFRNLAAPPNLGVAKYFGVSKFSRADKPSENVLRFSRKYIKQTLPGPPYPHVTK
jgi:hypothetical protein